jgi:hypothetical protein
MLFYGLLAMTPKKLQKKKNITQEHKINAPQYMVNMEIMQ